MATCEREPTEDFSFRGKRRRLDEEVLKISICKQQFKRWCNFKIKVKCTRDSEGIQILLDHWYRTFPDTSIERENGAKRKGRETRPMSTAGNGTLPNTETQNSEDEDCVTCTGLSPTEHVQTEIDSIPLKMEVDDDIVTEEPENTEIERVLSPSVMVTEDNLNKEIKKEKMWTQKFCFLSNCNQRVVPRHAEVKKLNEADLGNKVVNFTIDENPATFRESVFSACPQLREAGGFELFRRKSTFGLENISEPPGGFTTSYLMERNELNGIVCYVRPRKSISVKSIESCPRRIRNDLNFAQKIQVLDLLKQGRKQTEVARRMGCSQSVISLIASREKEIYSHGNNLNPSRKRLRPGKAADMEVALTNWFKSIYTPGKYIPNSIIMEQAELEARKLGNLSFNPTSGWLNRWKLRHNIPSTAIKKKRVDAQNKSTNEEEVSEQEVEEEEVAPEDAETEAVSQDDDSRSQNDDSVCQRDGTLSHNEDSNPHQENGMKQTEVAEKASEKVRSDGIVTKDLPDKGKETTTTNNSVEIPEYPRTHKRNDLSLKDEMRVIELLDQKLSQTKIAKQLGCSQSLISRIANSKDEVRAQFLTSENLNRRRKRNGKAPDVETVLWAWYQSLLDQEPGKQITNGMLKDQAKKLADEFGMPSFPASSGWLYRWKHRHNLVVQPYKKTKTKSHEKNNSTLENLNDETGNSITGASGLQSEEEEDQDDVSSELHGENNNTDNQYLSQNVEPNVELLATQPEKDTSGSSAVNVPDSKMNEKVETRPLLEASEKDTSASNIPEKNSHESDVRTTTLDKQLETQKLLATAFLHSLNILGPQTSGQGSSSLSPQLSGSAQEMVRNILELCQGPTQNPSTPTKNQSEEPKSVESSVAPSGVNTSMPSPKPSTVVSSVQNCRANETETCGIGLRTPSQTHMLSDSTSLDAGMSSIAHEPCSSSSTSTTASKTTSKDQANNSAIAFMPPAVSEIASSSTNTSCIDGTVGIVSSTSSKAPKKQTSTTNGLSTTSKSKSKLKSKSTPLSNVPEEPLTPRYSTRKRTTNKIVQKLAEEESEPDLNDDSDNDPNWEETERKKKSSHGHRNPKEDTDLSSDSDDFMESEEDEDAFDEDEDYEDEDSAPSKEERYTDDFKRKIILFAERHGNTKTAIRFHVCEEMVWKWREEKDTLFSVKGSSSNDAHTSGSQAQMTDEEIDNAISKFKTTQRRSFTSKFKLEVVAYAIQTNNMAAQRKYGVGEKLIRYWRKQRSNLENSKKNLRKLTPSRCAWPDLDALLKSWFFEQIEWGSALSLEIIRQKAIEFAEILKIDDFSGHVAWVARFLNRNKISLRQLEKERKNKMYGEGEDKGKK
ncbi:serine-rich adhesin for platelets-like [Saccostrea echinata]|uniref:serine-rich adhesin for platelets-like n=1 Tax=Saccostrea echinata TaxID=191078 RepID=UPI002A839C47|nr:serine-rich adhesin for platelets-like [Saccostrea echinata]